MVKIIPLNKLALVDLSKSVKTTKKATTKKATTKKATTKKPLTVKTAKADNKSIHKDLPPGGKWVTMHGHHVYIKGGKVLAGSVPGLDGSFKKATKTQLQKHQSEVDGKGAVKNEPKSKKPAGGANAGAGNNGVGSTTRKRSTKSAKAGIGKAVKESAKPSEDTVQSTRKFKMDEYKKWFTSLPASERKKVMAMDAPSSSYQVGVSVGTSAADAQKILNAFHHLRAQAGLSKTKAGKETSKKGVKDTRHKAQENREVAYDVGEKIGGARKDLATLSQRFEADPTAQDLESLEVQYPEAAQKLCTKKTLLNPLDWEAEMNNGVEVNVAMAKKLVYDRIATAPAANTAIDRMLYFNGIRNIQRVLEPIKTWDKFRDAVRELGDYMRLEKPRELQYAEWGVQNAEKEAAKKTPDNPYYLSEFGAHYDKDKEKWVIPKGAEKKWQAKQKEHLNKTLEKLAKVKVSQAAPIGLPLGEKFHDFFTDYKSRERTFDTIRSKRLTWEKYFADKANKTTKTSEASEPTLRPGEERGKVPVSSAKRVGGRKIAVSKPEDMVKHFGFRGVEFGNYVNDEAGKQHLLRSAEALQDLADVLGVKDKDVSLNGRLGMAFGARGKGGHLAHYEPMTKVINITRDAGAGTLAHEWGHAMDNILHAESTGGPSIGFASDSIGDKGSSEVRSAYENLMDKMLRGDGKEHIKPDGKNYRIPAHWSDLHDLPFNEAFKKATESLQSNYRAQLDWNERYYGNNPQKLRANIEKAKASYDKSMLNYYQGLASLYAKHGKEAKIPDYEKPTGRSQYATEADKLCKGKQGYWNRKHEMFARAFEAYVLDKLGSMKRRNDYLVAGTNDPRTYPQGHERELINGAFDKLMEAVHKTGAIQKGLSYDLQKSMDDDYYHGVKSGETERFAYQIDHETNPDDVLYIPVNRLNMVYQTDDATDWDKVKENMNRMQAGESLEPVVIGYDYDIHDGHHRWMAAKALDHTHVPCVVGGTNELQKQEALEKYRELWKSVIPDPVGAIDPFGSDPNTMYRGIGQKEMDFINKHGYVQSKGKGNDDDKGKVETCFTSLFRQAMEYAITNYLQYNEPAAYVLVLPKPPYVREDEHGELVSDQPVPFSVGVAVPIADPRLREDPKVAPFGDGEVLKEADL